MLNILKIIGGSPVSVLVMEPIHSIAATELVLCVTMAAYRSSKRRLKENIGLSLKSHTF